ncbi:IS30 family transposase [Ottowia sp.]|uniref:IS30 family transposase n=1 Tax=Ottowia sp. TaxID=1898956 RepID=UPI0025FC9B34|nr:IS30 family transposase [Ottowia sp.]MBK6745886.1 IS30 family transposase [Ottowia sp.]
MALGRSPSTISRELARNTGADAAYGSHRAQRPARRRRAARPLAKLSSDSLSWSLVMTLLDWKWSPQQIAATLKRTFPNEAARHVSHETIYTAIYAQPRGELRRQLIACLRQGRGTRLPRSRGTDRRGQIPEMVSIHCAHPRSRIADARPLGRRLHQGAGNKSSVGVLVERSSRLVLLAKMDDATASSALAGFTAKLNAIADPMRKSFTYDQGKEMSYHRHWPPPGAGLLCDPHAPGSAAPARTPTGCCASTCPGH